MWHKVEWMGHPMRLELTRVGLLVKFANHYTTKGAHGSHKCESWKALAFIAGGFCVYIFIHIYWTVWPYIMVAPECIWLHCLHQLLCQLFVVCFLASGVLPLAGADRAEGIFGFFRTRAGCSLVSGPTLKMALCCICPVVGRRTNKVTFFFFLSGDWMLVTAFLWG